MTNEHLQKTTTIFQTRSHRGRVRRQNQDYLEIDEDLACGVIADGVGGLNHGDIASKTAVKSCLAYIREQAQDARSTQSLVQDDYKNTLANSIKLANEHIITIQQNDANYAKMGTTLSCFIIQANMLSYSWIGDSRIYLYKAQSQRLELLSQDHTLDPNKMAPSSSGRLKKRASCVLTQMVGSLLLLKPGVGCCNVNHGDVVLACTDGLSDLISDDYLQQQLDNIQDTESASTACDKLLDKALDMGGHDNISFVLCRIT